MENSLNKEKEQHILIDNKILEKEIEISDITKKDNIIEIGAGPGNLTIELAKKANKVLAFEIDEKFKENLDNLKINIEIIYGNALNYSWKGYNKIVSNIPYSISEPLIWKSISDEINTIILIVGENFKKILFSQHKKIGILASLFFNIKPILFVGKNCFNPKPRTNSWVIKLERKKQDRIEEILGKILLSKSKTKNAIIYSLVSKGKTKNQAKEILKDFKFSNKTLEKPAKRITSKFILKLKENLEKNKAIQL